MNTLSSVSNKSSALHYDLRLERTPMACVHA